VRIPLDYYQILAITESNLSELEEAYRDRLLQLPRQGYSDAAIESRKQLITVAYEVLSDTRQRELYASELMPIARTGTDDSAPNSAMPDRFERRSELEIAPEHFLGGLLILFERGEYEEINSICMPYLGNNGRNSNSGSLHPQMPNQLTPSGNLRSAEPMGQLEPAAVNRIKRTPAGDRVIPLKPDIVLTMIFSFLELGDREWRDGCFEAATIHFDTAQKILIQEDLFPQIQGQIERRLDRLRPYRVSSLVALPLEQHDRRRQGIQFLEDLLETACTNEMQCQERFGLNSDRTIQFIHETLPHLTAAEQRNLFSQVARDSYQLGTNSLNVMQLACTYLHVYALIAQGFAYRNPQSIYTAQQILQYRLSQRLSVAIEQATCALLLGQIEEAQRLLDTAPESGQLVVIRQQSQGLSDLLRGLCWYIESWLRDEVFPCFRDLNESDPSIDAYFEDRDVQDFADRVPVTDSNISGWATSTPKLIDVPVSGDLSGNFSSDDDRTIIQPLDAGAMTPHSRRAGQSATTWQPSQDRLGSGKVAPAMRVEHPSHPPTEPPVPTAIPVEGATDDNLIHLEQERQRRRPSMPTTRTIDGQFEAVGIEDTRYRPPIVPSTASQLVPTPKPRPTGKMTRTRRQRRKPNIPRILFVGTSALACLWGFIWLVNAILRGLTDPAPISSTVATYSPSPTIPTSEPKVVSPSPKPQPKLVPEALSSNTAQQTITKWLSTKARSLGRDYETDRLKDILVEPALSVALDRAQTAKVNGVRWEYSHSQIAIEPMKPIAPTATTATVSAKVTEDAKYFEGERLNPARSYSKTFMVEYNLVRQADRWYVKDMDVVKTLAGG
jgi:curved DNA-binding protein CbpA